MRNASADRAAIAHRAIGDAAGDVTEQAGEMIRNAPVFDVGMGDAGADLEVVACIGHRGELRDGRDVDQQIGLGQAEVQHRPKRLAAGEDL